MSQCKPNDEIYLRYSRPGRKFLVGDPISISLFNPSEFPMEIVMIFKEGTKVIDRVKYVWQSNPFVIKPSINRLGPFQLVARTLNPKNQRKSNSIKGEILGLTEHNSHSVQRDRISEHKMDCAVGSNALSVLTLTNPWITPGNFHPESDHKWFPTEVYEGATNLYNEDESYYQDPKKYLFENLANLKKKGFSFVTWHDLIDQPTADYSSSVLLQFDVDAGPRSFMRISKHLMTLGVRASVMLHWSAKYWYSYEFEDDDIKSYQELEKEGWAFGYHNNTLTTLAALNPESIEDPRLIEQAQSLMTFQVKNLRANLNIKTITHHGGNIENKKVPIPQELNILPVDRYLNPQIWNQVVSTFSDGSFTARPSPMVEWVDEKVPGHGMIFMRCHPLKYGNYPAAHDVPPLVSPKSAYPSFDSALMRLSSDDPQPLDCQEIWLNLREKGRSGTKLYESSPSRPISSQFSDNEHFWELVEKFRATRKENFLRQYPWSGGDPRVVWWRVMSNFCPTGKILNVGAMPPDQKDETSCFIPSDAMVTEVDIDEGRIPDILGDFCDPNFSLSVKYDGILLNGLPYFSSPADAILNAWKLTKPGGRLMIGAAGASQPERGGLFRPNDRPIWREGKMTEKGVSLSLSTLLWSFDNRSISQLMKNWQGTYIAESLSHYWFVVAEKANT